MFNQSGNSVLFKWSWPLTFWRMCSDEIDVVIHQQANKVYIFKMSLWGCSFFFFCFCVKCSRWKMNIWKQIPPANANLSGISILITFSRPVEGHIVSFDRSHFVLCHAPCSPSPRLLHVWSSFSVCMFERLLLIWSACSQIRPVHAYPVKF